MSRSPRSALGMRMTGLVAVPLLAFAPFFGTAGAAPIDDDLRALAARLREFRTQVAGGELTPKGVDQEAKRVIAMKTDFVLAAEQESGVYLEPYLDLARIDDELEETRRRAARVRVAEKHLRAAVTATRGLIGKLFGRADAGSYEGSSGCLEDLEVSQEGLARDMRSGPAAGGASLSPGEIRRRVDELVAAKMTCIAGWPPVFGGSFQVVYGLLNDVDEELESIADPPNDSRADVIASIRNAIRRTRELRRQLEEWTTGTPSPTTTTRSPSPVRSASPTVTSSPSAQPSQSPAQSPTPEESPTGINPQPPNMSAITAAFDSQNHRTSYSISASDPDNDELTFSWNKSEERDCGSFAGSGRTATWNHQEPPCPVENSHPGTITVFVSDGTYTCSAFYEGGSASGTGPPPECGLHPRP